MNSETITYTHLPQNNRGKKTHTLTPPNFPLWFNTRRCIRRKMCIVFYLLSTTFDWNAARVTENHINVWTKKNMKNFPNRNFQKAAFAHTESVSIEFANNLSCKILWNKIISRCQRLNRLLPRVAVCFFLAGTFLFYFSIFRFRFHIWNS